MAAVSLIVPIYNVEKYLEKCLQSIEKQIFDDYEVILVDDGSIDNSRKIAELFIRKDPSKFKLIHQENQGLSGAGYYMLQVSIFVLLIVMIIWNRCI